MMLLRRAALSVIGVALAMTAQASSSNGNANSPGAIGADFIRVPLSVRQQGAGGIYGSYDVFKPFINPAMLIYQPRTWEVEATDQMLFGGGENLWGLAAGWGGLPTDAGTFGAAFLLSGVSTAAFHELDTLGNNVGDAISPSGTHVGLAGLYQWQFVSLGLGAHFGGTDVGSTKLAAEFDKSGFDYLGLDVGTAMSLGRLDVGVVYHQRSSDRIYGQSGISFGAALKLVGWVKGSINYEMEFPFAPATPAGTTVAPTAIPFTLAGGFTWNVKPFLDVRLGVVRPGSGWSPSVGFTVPYRDFALDYAISLPMGEAGGLGASHHVSLDWRYGLERKEVEGPKFMLGEKERTMAVANFDPQNVSAGDSAVISDMIRNQLIKEGSFNIVEKANMDKVLGEQAFQQTGCTTQECAVKLGKVLNVKYLVVGSFGKALDQYVLSMRVIDVETAKAVYSDEAYGKNLPEVRDGITTMAANLTKAVTGKK